MATLLVVETSPRADASVSRQMTRRFVGTWMAEHPGATVVERDLAETDLTFVTAAWLEAYFTPPESQTPEMAAQLALSDQLVDEVLAADHIVIATPVYNYNVPASLKAWIDLVVRKGRTLGFDGAGLVEHTSATVLLASGGVYTGDSPIRDRDLAPQYLRLVLGVLGIDEVSVVAGGNAKAVDLGDVTMADFVAGLERDIDAAAMA
ncbi:MAG: NAD(P)H-dependent oxidoreductase [Actinomycetota bacterium]